ncbi:PilW family protein [Pseudarthrobacter sp. H2]|uniref:PilW family protein n=1 Tax=Pseudarthrobacter sp. H2 TaxID=3418415 RepID=UPI003CF67F23
MITLVKKCRVRLQRSRDDHERGMTLTELLIASVVLMIVLTASSSLYISATKSMSMAGATNTNTANASNGMNELARVIRAGTSNPVVGQPLDDPAFLEAQPESVILYSYVSLDPAVPKPVMTHFYLNSQRQLVEDRWPATGPLNGYWSFPSPFPGTAKYTPPQSSRILTTTVPLTGSAANLFTYYKDVQGKDATTILSSIVAVKITLTVQQSLTNNSSPVTLENLVGIPNLNALENIL